MSKVFSQELQVLVVKHQGSSAYHPERFHQTVKTTMLAYCLELVRNGMKVYHSVFLLFKSVQESSGFSLGELAFSHTVRGPLKLLHEQLTGFASPSQNVCYVSSFRKHLGL